MAKVMPLAELLDSFRRYRKCGTDPWVLASQLNLLPSLDYLADGLVRSRGCVRSFSAEFEYCLRAVPGTRLEPEELIGEIDHLLRWVELQSWAADDGRLKVMARESADAPHPLAGDCLSVNFHWPNLFYTLEPQDSVGAGPPADSSHQPYERLMEEFSIYVVAAQSTIPPEAYSRFCREWWVAKSQPARAPFPQHRLFNRVAGASRAMRKLTLKEYTSLFTALRNLSGDVPFYERVFAAKGKRWTQDEQTALNAIALMLEDVVPGWRRRTGNYLKGGETVGAQVPSGVKRREFRDGYVRVSGTDCVATTYESESGILFESIIPKPQTPTDLVAEYVEQLKEDEQAHALESDAKKASKAEKERAKAERALERERRIALATAEAEAELDGHEWLPVDDTAGDIQIDAAILPTDSKISGVSPGSNSRWAAEHRRRHHLSHRLVPGRLGLAEIKSVLAAMMQVDPESENAKAIVCLHAGIALGRSLQDACSLLIHQSMPGLGIDAERIHYVLDDRQWIVFTPPPAFESRNPRSVQERIRWPMIRLADWTGFDHLLSHLGLAVPGQPVRRLSVSRTNAVADWLQEILPHDDIRLSSCPRLLFNLLLDTNNGDLGIAQLISGQTRSHGGSVAHYSHYRAAELWAAYARAWGREYVIPAASEEQDQQPRGYGAHRVPTRDSVRGLMQWLQTKLQATPLVERHNHYTAYSWAALVLGTAMRPVREPHIFSPGEDAAEQLIVTFLDKARTDYHRRVNAVPKALAEHLYRYAQYLRSMDRLIPTDDKRRQIAFRFVEPSGEVRAFRPSDFEALCSEVFDFELYSLRRFARTELAGCGTLSGEDLDAYMGHWFDGVSPHDRLSTYPITRLHSVALHEVTNLLKAVSFKPLWIDQWLR